MVECTCCRSKCCKSFRLDWHYSKLWFFHDDWKAFAFTPWLPITWKYQLIYLTYRWILAIYFFCWLIISGVDEGGRTYFIYLSHLAFILFNIYFIIAAFSTTAKWVSVHFILWPPYEQQQILCEFKIRTEKPTGRFGCGENKIRWYQMFQWLFFVIGNEMAFLISVLYWTFLYRGQVVTGVTVNIHLINGVMSLVDLWVSGTPVNTLHVIYPMILGAIYCILSGIYFGISGDIIYEKVLDYENNPGRAIAASIAVIFVVLPIIHIGIFYLQYVAKFWILHYIFGRQHHTPPQCNLTNEVNEGLETVEER